MERMRTTLMICLLSLFFLGCTALQPYLDLECKYHIRKVLEEWGQPDEITSYDSAGYHKRTYWYDSRGIALIFTWSKYNSDLCETSVYKSTRRFNK